MTRIRCVTSSLLLLAAALPLTAGDAPPPKEAATILDAFSEGTFGGGARYRLDFLDQDNFTKDAVASTLRLNLNYRTLPFHGFSGYLELYDNAVIGNQLYWNLQNGFNDRPLIADPPGDGVNEAYGRYANKDLLDTTITVGRQLFTINDEVMVTASRYRQNNNRLDASSIEMHPLPDLMVQYAYVWGHIDVFDFYNPMSTHIGNIKYGKKDIGSISAYGIMLNYDDHNNPTRDVTTYGARIDGPFKLDEKWSVLYEADIAKQVDSGDNTQNIDADYLMARVGVSYEKWYASIGYRHQSGADGSSAQPFEASWLGYPWPWRGDTEQMVLTPADGLNTIMVWAGGAIPAVPGLGFDLFYFKFDSDVNSIDYGSEYSAALNYSMPFAPKWWVSGLIAKSSQGDVNAAYFDATRAVFMTGYSF